MKKTKDSAKDSTSSTVDTTKAQDPSRRDFLGKVGVGAALSAAPFIGAAKFMEGGTATDTVDARSWAR
jgi:hypothetical protein